MSRAFVKETEGTGFGELPELVVSPHRNLVTAAGLALIEATLARLEARLATARAAADREATARAERDLRYWRQRRVSAELVPHENAPTVVRFGCAVVLDAEDGGRIRFRLVGEDEADPARGLISWVSPLGQDLLGCSIGDEVGFRDGLATVAAIE